MFWNKLRVTGKNSRKSNFRQVFAKKVNRYVIVMSLLHLTQNMLYVYIAISHWYHALYCHDGITTA